MGCGRGVALRGEEEVQGRVPRKKGEDGVTLAWEEVGAGSGSVRMSGGAGGKTVQGALDFKHRLKL